MSKWASQRSEFHELLLPNGDTVELDTASKNGKWVLSSQGWGIPGINWQTTQGPYQHGQTVRDYRLQPRTIQLLVNQAFCSRDNFWGGREDLVDSLKPNQNDYTFEDYWLQRSQADVIQAHDIITAICEWNGHLYGLTKSAYLLMWDDVGSWQIVAAPPGNATVTMIWGMALCAGDLELPDYPTMVEKITNPVPDPFAWVDSVYVRGDDWAFQNFIPDQKFTCGGARIYCDNYGNNTITVTVSIEAADGFGYPDGVVLSMTSETVAVNDSGWLKVYLPAIELSAGVQYCLVVSAVVVDPIGDVLLWGFSTGDVFTGGRYGTTGDGGVSWSLGVAANDLIFEMLEITGNVTKNLLWATGRGDDGGNTSIAWAFDGTWSDYYWAYHTDDTYGRCCAVHEGELYVGTSATGKLRRYPRMDADHILDEAATCAEPALCCMASYQYGMNDNQLYVGTAPLAELWMYWPTAGTITQYCTQAGGTENFIVNMVVYQGNLYGVSETGQLWMAFLDPGPMAWELKAGPLVDVLPPNEKICLTVYKGRLYCAGKFGDLYVWDNVSAWILVCSIIVIGAAQNVTTMTTYRNRMFAGTSEASALIEYIHERQEDEVRPLVLRRHLSNGENRDLEVVISEGPQFDDQDGRWHEWSFKELLRLTAYNPVMYNPVMLTETFTMGVGFIDESRYITYMGNWEEHPVITVEGPLNGLTVINETLDTMFQLDYSIPDGVTVVIDCAKLSITDSLHNNLLSTLAAGSEFARFRLEPTGAVVIGGGGLVFPLTFPLAWGAGATTTQANLIRVIGNGADAGTTLKIDYYRRFIGI